MEERTKIFIWVEGSNDKKFLTKFFCDLYSFSLQDIKQLRSSTEIKIENKSFIIHIRQMGTWSVILNNSTHQDIGYMLDTGYKCIVIVDADDLNKDSITGGFEKRKECLNKIKIDNNLDFDIFIFPNHKDDGDLETILINSIPNERKIIYECIDNYGTCLDENLKKIGVKNKKLDKKNKFYQMYSNIFKGDFVINYEDEGCLKVKAFFDNYLDFED